MALKIIRANEPIPVDSITVNLYGEPGVGKTTLACTANDMLLIDTDGGAHRAGIIIDGKRIADVVSARKWDDISQITPHDIQPYKTVGLDTAGAAIDFLGVSIMNSARKGFLNQNDWGTIKRRFREWHTKVTNCNSDVIFVSHSRIKRIDEEEKEEMDVAGGSRALLESKSDLIGRLYTVKEGIMLSFNPSTKGIGKNPAGLEDQVVDPSDKGLMARVIAQAKEALQQEGIPTMAAREAVKAESVAQVAEFPRALIKHFHDIIEECSSVKTMNLIRGQLREAYDEGKFDPVEVKELQDRMSSKADTFGWAQDDDGVYIEWDPNEGEDLGGEAW